MLVITMASRKGGVGKSSCARALAVQALIDGMRTALIDADPQGTVLAWAKRREATAPTVYGLDGTTLEARLASLKAANADLVLIDTPPSVHPIIGIGASIRPGASGHRALSRRPLGDRLDSPDRQGGSYEGGDRCQKRATFRCSNSTKRKTDKAHTRSTCRLNAGTLPTWL